MSVSTLPHGALQRQPAVSPKKVFETGAYRRQIISELICDGFDTMIARGGVHNDDFVFWGMKITVFEVVHPISSCDFQHWSSATVARASAGGHVCPPSPRITCARGVELLKR